jgi:predicted GNAT family N-acyltransferase
VFTAHITYTIRMTNAVIIQRLTTLEREVQAIKSHMGRVATSPAKDEKKLTRGIRVALREIEEGKEIGPFNSVEEFMIGIK